jgi:hypothetical protein
MTEVHGFNKDRPHGWDSGGETHVFADSPDNDEYVGGPNSADPFVPWTLDEPHVFEPEYHGKNPTDTYFGFPDVQGDITELGDLPPQ